VADLHVRDGVKVHLKVDAHDQRKQHGCDRCGLCRSRLRIMVVMRDARLF
jgi:hypothetical protein